MLAYSEIIAGMVGALATIVAAWLGGWWTFRGGERKIEAEQVIAERAKWREKLRLAMDDLVVARSALAARRVAVLLELNTSPTYPEDVAIVTLAKSISHPATQQIEISELVTRVSLLLKHDWERAKGEAGLSERPARRIMFDRLEQERVAAELLGERYWSGQHPTGEA